MGYEKKWKLVLLLLTPRVIIQSISVTWLFYESTYLGMWWKMEMFSETTSI